MSLFQEFKTFISRGNVVDLAIAVVIGAAFGRIVTSVVDDLLMPPLGMLINNVDFKELRLVIGGTAEAPVTINYGNFIQVIIQFVIVAFAVFLLVKGINTFRKKEAAAPAPPPAPTSEEKLLAEIRDILKSQTSNGRVKDQPEMMP
jgi:large conductance mechanosensitive channel